MCQNQTFLYMTPLFTFTSVRQSFLSTSFVPVSTILCGTHTLSHTHTIVCVWVCECACVTHTHTHTHTCSTNHLPDRHILCAKKVYIRQTFLSGLQTKLVSLSVNNQVGTSLYQQPIWYSFPPLLYLVDFTYFCLHKKYPKTLFYWYFLEEKIDKRVYYIKQIQLTSTYFLFSFTSHKSFFLSVSLFKLLYF